MSAPDPKPDPRPDPRSDLTRHRAVTVVCAHPDDESFGLGAIISILADADARLGLVCCTAGEGSRLGAGPGLAARRARELDCAAEVLGIDRVTLLDHPDGSLASVPLPRLSAEIIAAAGDTDALLTFDRGGITGHPDHEHATDAALAAARRLGVPLWAWAVPGDVAAILRDEFDVPFVGRETDEVDLTVAVDRSRQHRAVDCHGSQLADNPVPHRRIELQGATESLRLLHDPTPPRPPSPPQEIRS